MKNKDKINLRREKLRKLLLEENEENQYQAYSNNFPESLLNKFIIFKNYNSTKDKKEEEKNNYYKNELNNNKRINNFQANNLNNNNYYNKEINFEANNTLNRNINENTLGQNNIENNKKINQENNYSYNNEFSQLNNRNNININPINNSESYKYGNSDIDAEINGYSDYYNKLKVDEFMSKKKIQDDLLNQINQKLNNINKNINDKAYQENLAFQYFQNKNRINNENNL